MQETDNPQNVLVSGKNIQHDDLRIVRVERDEK